MGHLSSCEFFHSQIAYENLFNCLWAYCRPLHEHTRRKERVFAEKLKYGRPNVSARSPRPEFVITRKVAVFEAPTPTLDCRETNISFSKDSTKFPMYHFRSLPLHEKKFRHASLLMILHLDPLNVHFNVLMGQSVGDSTVAIEQRMGIQI
jgi:hypothetical protein